jgi:hypothetical protein
MRRIDFAPLLAVVGGAVLLVSLFLHWYQPAITAWTAFEVWDLVLAVLAIAGIWVAVAGALWEAPLRDGALPVIGGAAFVIVVSQLVNHPPAAQGASLQSGAWLGLGGATLMAVAGVLSWGDISLSVSLSSGSRSRDDERERRRPAPAAPESPPPPRRSGRPSPANEAAAIEPEVHEELYPVEERSGPIGADDPELWREPSEDETLPFDHESDERT